MRILITGADGFIGKNLRARLQELEHSVLPWVRGDTLDMFATHLRSADAIIHLAGENRPADPQCFQIGNVELTAQLCTLIRAEGRSLPLVFSSSTQAMEDNAYGRSKRAAEEGLVACAAEIGGRLTIYRLPGVFGKWGKPNYNSVVATFCHNIARDLPIQVRDPAAEVRLVYVDDVVEALIQAAVLPQNTSIQNVVSPEYKLTLGELAKRITGFRESRHDLSMGRVGTGLMRALYSTYVSYLPTDGFVYDIPEHRDARGTFVEMLKTSDSGQFSFFTAHPGVTRGGHYHHTKTEKFLVIRGSASFGFRHIISGEIFRVEVSGEHPQVVETVPGWAHDITNVGDGEMIVMLWSNEVFDRSRPDTIACKV